MKDLIDKMLVKDPMKRITLPEIKVSFRICDPSLAGDSKSCAFQVHPWVTCHGVYPLASEEENCVELIEITDHEVMLTQFAPIRTFHFMAATECVNSSVSRFGKKFLWKFPWMVGHTTTAVQPGKKKIARGTSTKLFTNP